MPALPFRQNPIAGLLVAALLVLLFALPGSLAAQTIVNVTAQQCVWHSGDDLAWSAPNLDESGWQPYTQWRSQYGQTHFWVRCNAELNALSSEVDPELQVSLYSAYTIYLDGQQVGGAGNLDSGIFNMDAIRSFPVGAARIHSGASTIALRITERSVLTNSGPVNALVSGPLELRVGNASILDAFRARAALTRSLQYLGSATCYAVIGVLAIMLIGLYLYDRSRYEFLQLSITCLSLATLRLNELAVAAYLPFSFPTCLNIVSIGNIALTFTQFPFFFALAKRRTPRIVWGVIVLVVALQLFVGSNASYSEHISSWFTAVNFVFIRPFALSFHILLALSPFVAFWPYRAIPHRVRPLAALCMLWALADLVWFGAELTAFHFFGMPDIFQYWGVTLLEVRAFTTAGVTAALLALLFRDQRLATEEHALFAGEIQAARDVQQYLIPEHLPPTPGFSIESEYRPAREVGGDFFQVLPDSTDGSLLVVVGDVAGKGVEAGMLATLIVGAVRTAASFTSDPTRILGLLNERLCGRGFVTCLALRIDAHGNATLVNAGHVPPYLNGKEMAVEGALPLGVIAGMQFPAAHFRFADGDSMVLMTDGVAEAQDPQGRLFGFARISELLGGGAGSAALAAAAQDFGQQDDITILTLVRVKPSEQASSVPAASTLASALSAPHLLAKTD
jgi:hypothetical protein